MCVFFFFCTLFEEHYTILNILHLFKADFKLYILDFPDTESIRILDLVKVDAADSA